MEALLAELNRSNFVQNLRDTLQDDSLVVDKRLVLFHSPLAEKVELINKHITTAEDRNQISDLLLTDNLVFLRNRFRIIISSIYMELDEKERCATWKELDLINEYSEIFNTESNVEALALIGYLYEEHFTHLKPILRDKLIKSAFKRISLGQVENKFSNTNRSNVLQHLNELATKYLKHHVEYKEYTFLGKINDRPRYYWEVSIGPDLLFTGDPYPNKKVAKRLVALRVWEAITCK